MSRTAVILSALLALVASAAGLPQAAAQTPYPAKPVRIVVPYPPGGPSDLTTRIYAQGLTELFRQQFIVENRPGGGTNIAAEYAARAPADGYTLYMANFASHAVNRWLFKSLSYDPAKDFAPVAMMIRGPMFLCTKLTLTVNSVADLIALARQKPGALTYASTGNGSPPHITGEYLKYLAKIDVVHVPYRGSAEMIADLLAGQIDYGFDSSVVAQGRAGKLKCLAVSSPQRWPSDPDIPTIAESGLPGFDLVSFFGIVAPAATPLAIRETLNEAFRKIAAQPETKSRLAVTANLPFPATLQETADFLREQDTKWAPIVKASGATVD